VSEQVPWRAAQLGRVATPLRDQVLNIIRQAILDFELRPGQRLIERELVDQLSVSRATIREVLALLVSEGLVTVIPQKGAIVSILSPGEAADLYEIRSSLEVLTVRRFTERAHPEQVRELRDAFEQLRPIAERLEQVTDHADTIAWVRAKDDFYGVLLQGANSPALTQLLTTLQGRVRFLRVTSVAVPGRAMRSFEELNGMLELIEAGDGDKAARACSDHLRNAAKAGLGKLDELERLTVTSA
jgi:DNA-binding GntR family transcriptional regulator